MNLKDLEHPVVSAIYKAYEENNAKEKKRGYLGASIIGAKCERFLWYTFRECCEEKFEGRMLRLFNTGDREEDRMVKDLQAIGCLVHPIQLVGHNNPGKQWEIFDLGDHFSGHLDAVIHGLGECETEWWVGEFKTHNKKSFDDLKAKKVKRSKPLHYAQMQVYMHKMGLKKALYLAVHKDTDTLYAEIVEYDQICAEILMERAKRIITATSPQPRYSEDRNSFECTYCAANLICWGNPNWTKLEDILPRKSCRQCKYIKPDIEQSGAKWICREHYDCDTQVNPCAGHEFIPGLLPNDDVEDTALWRTT